MPSIERKKNEKQNKTNDINRKLLNSIETKVNFKTVIK